MSQILQKLKDEILLLDGAMGTELQKRGLNPGECPEKLNLEQPNMIFNIHQSYIEAGSDIIQTNTFGANRSKLKEYNLENRIDDINKEAVNLTKKAISNNQEDDIFVSGSIGPTGKLLEPIGDFSFQSAYEIFKEQLLILKKAGVDLINIETMTDIQEARAALIAVKENTSLPVICNLTFDKGGKTVSGTDPQTAVIVLEGLEADIIGVNCSLGPEGMLQIVKEISDNSRLPISFQPNAGLPQLNDRGETEFPLNSAEMAEYVIKAVEAGSNIIGGCCGTGPEYIKKAAGVIKSLEDIPENSKSQEKDNSTVKLASRTKTVKINPEFPTKIIGEKINPSGKEELKLEMENMKVNLLAKEAEKQIKAGADVLDVNVGVAGVDQSVLMKKALDIVHNQVDVPVAIDTDDISVIEDGLKSVVGRPLINSVTGEKERLNKILPLAKKYGAAVVGLTMDKTGIPETVEGRYQIAEFIVEKCREIGLEKNDILIDPLVLTVSTSQKQLQVTLNSLKLIRDKLSVNTILGISNISYGLPKRETINQSLLPMALQAGLSVPIMDPTDKKLMQILKSCDILIGRDPGACNYINMIEENYTENEYSETDLKKSNNIKASKENESNTNNTNKSNALEDINQQILKGNKEIIKGKIETALQNYKPDEIINSSLIPTIRKVGSQYESGQCFLPQLMASAETVQEALQVIRPYFQKEKREIKGRVLLATVKGDLHDIGKNLVKLMLRNNGFEVIDLGKNINDQQILEKAAEIDIDIIALSSLMTTTMSALKRVTKKVKETYPEIKVLIGGAVVNDEFAEKIGADGYARDAFGAVKEAERIIEEIKLN